MLDLLATMVQWLEAGEDVALAAVVAQSGSTPRAAGATMAVRYDGRIAGTIGGGIVEAKVIESCKKLLARPGPLLRLERFDLDNTQAAQAGMICGGRLEFLERSFRATTSNAVFFRRAWEGLRKGRPVSLLCELGPATGCFLLQGGEGVAAADAEARLPEPEMLRKALEAGALQTPQKIEEGGQSALVLPFIAPDTAVLVGAGHVALHTAAILALSGFRVVVIDDREDFANAERFPGAAEILVPDGFEDCLNGIPITPRTSIVILTRGHLHDKTVLAQALRTPAGYIGMIGSRRKRDATYAALLAEGVDQAAIDRVHCPIGLDIGAETPEEIAVSIAAEMIQDRARRRQA